MTQAEYNQHVTRCAQLVVGLAGGNKSQAKAGLSATLAGTRDTIMPGGAAAAVSLLLLSAHAHAGDGLPLKACIGDVAWAAHLADVSAKIDTLP